MRPPARPAKKRRGIQRMAHLVASVMLLAYLYTPLGENEVFGVMLRVMVVPVIAVSGLLMWQWPRLSRMRGARLGRVGHYGTNPLDAHRRPQNRKPSSAAHPGADPMVDWLPHHPPVTPREKG